MSTRNKIIPAVLGILMLSPPLAFAQSVLTADDKSSSGGSCSPAMQSDYSDFDIRANYIQNRSTGYRWVSCSMTLDSEVVWNTADNGVGTNNGYARSTVYVRYGGSSGTTTCTWQVIDSSGNVVETASDSQDGLAKANYGLISGNLYEGSGDTRSLGVNCVIPPGARLHRINWEEYVFTSPETTY